jgi:hypothetical protein
MYEEPKIDWQAGLADNEAALAKACEVRSILERALDRGHQRTAEACRRLLEVMEG